MAWPLRAPASQLSVSCSAASALALNFGIMFVATRLDLRAIFLIRKGALRPPAGSAARARPGRARGPWGRQYYGVSSPSRRRGPVNARRAAGDKMPLLLNKPHRNAPRATERFLAESSFRFVAASASRDAAKRARDVASRSAPVVRARDGPHRDFLEEVGGGGGGASTARGRGDGAGGASSTRGESPARDEVGKVGPSRPRRRTSSA